MPSTSKKKKNTRLQVNVELTGELADRFLSYKETQSMRTNAATGYKLLVERLNDVLPRQEVAEGPAATHG